MKLAIYGKTLFGFIDLKSFAIKCFDIFAKNIVDTYPNFFKNKEELYNLKVTEKAVGKERIDTSDGGDIYPDAASFSVIHRLQKKVQEQGPCRYSCRYSKTNLLQHCFI